MHARVYQLAVVLDSLAGDSVQERWAAFEATVWPSWIAGRDRQGGNWWRWGTWGAVLTRTVGPSWTFISTGRVGQWTNRLPRDHPLRVTSDRLRALLAGVAWADERGHATTVGGWDCGSWWRTG